MKNVFKSVTLIIIVSIILSIFTLPVCAVNLDKAMVLPPLKTVSFSNSASDTKFYLFKISLLDAGKISFFKLSSELSSTTKLSILNSSGKAVVSRGLSDIMGKSISINKKGTYYVQVKLPKSESVKGFGYTFVSNSGKSVSKSISINVGKTYDCSSYVNGFNGTLKWTTSKSSVAKVSTKGIITAANAGEAKIRAYSSKGDYAQFTVTVSGITNTTDYVDVKSTLNVDIDDPLNIYYDLRNFQRTIMNQRVVADPDVYNEELGRYEYTSETTARVDTSKSITSPKGTNYYLVVGGKFKTFSDVKQYIFSLCSEDKAQNMKNSMGGYGAFCEYNGKLYAEEEDQLWWNTVFELYHLSACVRSDDGTKMIIDSSGRTKMFNEYWYEADCLVLLNTGNGYKYSDLKDENKPIKVKIGNKTYYTTAKSLDLSNKNLTDSDLSNLVYFSELEELDLSGNELTSYWAIIPCKKLKILDVRGNDISSSSTQSGYDVLKLELTNLKTIRK